MQKLKKRINHNSSIKIGSRNIFKGDSAIGENAKIIKSQYIIDNSTTYDVDMENVAFLEKTSILVINKYGEKKLTLIGVISLIAGLITIFEGVDSVLGKKFIFSWLPEWISTAPQNFGTPLIVVGLMLSFFGGFLIYLVQYKYDSRCPKCNRFYALKEVGEPQAREVEVRGGLRKTITRTYKCKYDDCNHIVTKKKNEFIENQD